MVDDQDLPFGAFLAESPQNAFAAIFDRYPAAGSAKSISAGINRVGKEIIHRRVDRQLPQKLMLLWAFVINVRERDPVGPKRQKHLTDALHLGKTGENQPDRLVYAQIRIHFDFLAAHFHVANRYRKKEFSPPRFLLQSFHGTGAQERQFEFAHRALHTQQQPIVWMTWFIDAVLIDDQRADQTAELDQRVPVTPISRQTRCLDGEHSTHMAFADRGKQSLESRTADARARATKIVINDSDIGPTKNAGAIGQSILT